MRTLKPLSDDWLFWDPETIHAYPEVELRSLGQADLDIGAHSLEQGREDQQPPPARSIRSLSMEILRYVGAALLVGFVAGMMMTLLVVFFPAMVHANELDAGEVEAAAHSADVYAGPAVRLSEVTRGSLLFTTDHSDLYRHAPTLDTDVHIRITGPIARVSVKQNFHNPGQDWVEGIYVFPLPENAAVDHMRMHVGERIIEGEIMERAEAKKIYTTAKKAGKKAALVEQERPNIFTNSVANIGPGEEVRVEIEYQQTLRYDQGEFSIRFPMVVAPRYIPGAPATVEETVTEFNGMGWALNTHRVPDASRITPPVMDPRKGKINPVSLTVDLRPGFPLSRLDSPYHSVRVEATTDDRSTVTLDQGAVPADRDFVLIWAPKVGFAPKAALFTERAGEETYALLMVMPPDTAQSQTLPREVIYIIDTSGSMGGASIRQAKRALTMAVDRLRPGDRFNVIQFNSHAGRLFHTARVVDSKSREKARRYIRSLKASGGTNMRPALKMALGGTADPSRVRQVVFLTDGAVGNESELFGLIKERLGDSRLFTVGIGSAPNSHFMSKAAQFGHGTFTYIGKISEVREKMEALFTKLETPMMSHIEVSWPESAGPVEAWPKRLPDLYTGEPLVVAAQVEHTVGEVVVSGRRNNERWRATLKFNGGQEKSGIGIIWARRKIAALMDSIHEGADRSAVRKEVIGLGLTHHLVTRYTSLIAVDVTPSRPDTSTLKSGAVPTNLPHGWEYEKVFGQLPQTATPATLHLLMGLFVLSLTVLLHLWQRRSV